MVHRKNLKVSPKQLSLLHVAKKELALDEGNYRSMLNTYGVESAKDLTQKQFKHLVKYLETLGFTSSNKKAKAPNRDPNGLPYPAQLELIEKLFLQNEIFEPKSQRVFCKRIIKTHWAQTRTDANKIIEALKAMLARKRKIV